MSSHTSTPTRTRPPLLPQRLDGETVGFLTIIGRDDSTRQQGSKGLFAARCQCGNTIHAPAWRLRSGDIRHCGCMQRVSVWDAARDAVVRADWPAGVPYEEILPKLVAASPTRPVPTQAAVKHRALGLGVKRPGYDDASVATDSWSAERIALLRDLWLVAELTVVDIRLRLRAAPGAEARIERAAIYRKAKALNLGRRPLVPERLAAPQIGRGLWTPARDDAMRAGWAAGWSNARLQSHIASIDADRPPPSLVSIKNHAVYLGLGARPKLPKPPAPKKPPALRKRIVQRAVYAETAPPPAILTRDEMDALVDVRFAKAREMVARLKSLRDVEQEVVREIADKAGVKLREVRIAIGLVRVARHEGAGA